MVDLSRQRRPRWYPLPHSSATSVVFFFQLLINTNALPSVTQVFKLLSKRTAFSLRYILSFSFSVHQSQSQKKNPNRSKISTLKHPPFNFQTKSVLSFIYGFSVCYCCHYKFSSPSTAFLLRWEVEAVKERRVVEIEPFIYLPSHEKLITVAEKVFF